MGGKAVEESEMVLVPAFAATPLIRPPAVRVVALPLSPISRFRSAGMGGIWVFASCSGREGRIAGKREARLVFQRYIPCSKGAFEPRAGRSFRSCGSFG